MTLVRRRKAALRTGTEPVELIVAPAAIERALHVFEQLQSHDISVILQARKILTQHIFGMVDQGELDEQKADRGRSRSLEGRRARPWNNKVGPCSFQVTGKSKASSPV